MLLNICEVRPVEEIKRPEEDRKNDHRRTPLSGVKCA
jgi:hypothetical protein